MDHFQGKQMHADWSALPNHVLGTIFGYLTENDRYNASLVCRSWKFGFCAPEAWRKFTLSIWRTKKYHRRIIPRRKLGSDSLSVNLLSVVARNVRYLEIDCPWPDEDGRGSASASRRLSRAIGDLRHRGCQLQALALRNFERITYSWNDQKARLRIIKALKRFINQKNLTTIDLQYTRLKLREVMVLLSAATYRSAATVTSLYIQGAFFCSRFPHPTNHFDIQNPLQQRIFNEEWQLQNVIAQELREFNDIQFRNLGTILSRFIFLRNLYLLLDGTVLKMELLQCLPPSVCLLNFLVRRREMEGEEFGTAIPGNSICDNREWKKLTERCPHLVLEFDIRGILWYYPLLCILQPMAPLKRIRLFSPRELHPLQLETFLLHLLKLYSAILENVDVCIFGSHGLDNFLSKLHQNCKCLKSLRFRGAIGKSKTMRALCWAFATRKIGICQLNIVAETKSKALFDELRVMKYEFCKWLNWDGEDKLYKVTNKTTMPWNYHYSNQKSCNFQFGIIRMPPRRNTSDIVGC